VKKTAGAALGASHFVASENDDDERVHSSGSAFSRPTSTASCALLLFKINFVVGDISWKYGERFYCTVAFNASTWLQQRWFKSRILWNL
jgi:hypothetical protein